MSELNDADRRMDRFKLDGDLRDAYVELLSAQSAIERVRMRYSPQEVAQHGSSFMVARSVSAATAICEFFSLVHKALLPQAGPPPQSRNDKGGSKSL